MKLGQQVFIAAAITGALVIPVFACEEKAEANKGECLVMPARAASNTRPIYSSGHGSHEGGLYGCALKDGTYFCKKLEQGICP